MASQRGKKTKEKKKPKILTPADKAARQTKQQHKAVIRKIFSGTGFKRLAGVEDKEFTFNKITSEIDDIFVFENVVVILEYTCTQDSDVGAHLKNKKLIFDQILNNQSAFIDLLKIKFTGFAPLLGEKYHQSKIILKIVYCSRFDLDQKYQINVPGPVYLDYPAVRYFLSVVGAIKRSARFELLDFLDINVSSVGNSGKIIAGELSKSYCGSILPEAHSNFAKGYKIVSFYADAEALLRTSYVMRKDGWRDPDNLYQRMISASKIRGIRAYLRKQDRVFLNNIIVTLPSDVQPVLNDKSTIKLSTLTETKPITIQLPDRANSIGIIDGQHRIFAYHETEDDDEKIALLRVQQHLLVTGIIYPDKISEHEKAKFEAKLFLEINSNQSSAQAPLKQAIGLVINPFANDSIATRVLNGLAKNGPLKGYIQLYFWEKEKLRTASIVSYGLKPLVKTSGNDSLFSMWNHEKKKSIIDGSDEQALRIYIDFCITNINILLGAIKANIQNEKWNSDKKVKGSIISTTYINSFLIFMRLLVEKKIEFKFDNLKASLAKLEEFPFSSYRSSQYRRMAEEIVVAYFGELASPPAMLPTSEASRAKTRKPKLKGKVSQRPD